jgi:glycosyltransferase involved in cell wall biosynthesis
VTISLILPYWNRQEAADRALKSLADAYPVMQFEVIVVDDGSPVPFKVPDVPLNIRVVTLPRKNEPKSPVTCWNAGVREAKGDMIALSCIEVLHGHPVLERMAEQLRILGPQGYVLASAWCPEEDRWHTHSTVPVPDCPDGTGLAFLGLMYRDLYLKAGGWDEDYREGAGYEDRDFIHRMTAVGAKFLVRDDLVVTHPKSGASIQWGAEKFARNQALFMSKWVRPLNIVCVKHGTMYGPEYVNRLFDMVRRNLPAGNYRFTCFTEDATGIDPEYHIRPLPEGLSGWWNKLYLFKEGLFPKGERVIFFDLDTVIVGQLDAIVNYSGAFATLRDFWRPEGLGPAVILWEAGQHTAIWQRFDDAGRPLEGHGDQSWLQWYFVNKPLDILQDHFPGDFVSFKTHCHPYPPKGTKVVCFHGEPRPHNCNVPWVADVWKVGGVSMAELTVVANTEDSRVAENIRHACSLPFPWLPRKSAHSGRAVICAGGPSLKSSFGSIKAQRSPVFAVNGVAALLCENGIQTMYHVIMDARPGNVSFIGDFAPHYLVASQCDRVIFDALQGKRVTLFHMNTAGVLDCIPENDKPVNLISSGTTVGLAAMAIVYTLGFRDIHLYGYDSSFEGEHHAYPQSSNDDDVVIDAVAGERTFKTTPWMVKQVQEFQTLALNLAELGCSIEVHGDGLLPHVARLMTKQEIAA